MPCSSPLSSVGSAISHITVILPDIFQSCGIHGFYKLNPIKYDSLQPEQCGITAITLRVHCP